jgi:cytosine deaminase
LDLTNVSGSEALLQEKEIELYAKFRSEKLEQDLEDWRGRVHCGKMNKKHMQD